MGLKTRQTESPIDGFLTSTSSLHKRKQENTGLQLNFKINEGALTENLKTVQRKKVKSL